MHSQLSGKSSLASMTEGGEGEGDWSIIKEDRFLSEALWAVRVSK